MSRHPDQPEWIIPQRPHDRIRQMPALIAELAALDGTRNPSDRPAIHHPPVFTSRPPCNEDTIHLLDPREDHPWGGLARLQSISRIIWTHLGDDGRAAHPQPRESSWHAETEWLNGAWTESVETMPYPDYTAAAERLDALYHDLTRAVGLRPAHRIHCPNCPGGTLDIHGDMLICTDCGHQQPGPHRLISQWARHDAMTTTDICTHIPGVTPDRLRQWKRRGRIKTAGEQPATPGHGKESMWIPWDVITCAYPGILDTLTAGKDDAA
jgi:hypothetical protein